MGEKPPSSIVSDVTDRPLVIDTESGQTRSISNHGLLWVHTLVSEKQRMPFWLLVLLIFTKRTNTVFQALTSRKKASSRKDFWHR